MFHIIFLVIVILAVSIIDRKNKVQKVDDLEDRSRWDSEYLKDRPKLKKDLDAFNSKEIGGKAREYLLNENIRNKNALIKAGFSYYGGGKDGKPANYEVYRHGDRSMIRHHKDSSYSVFVAKGGMGERGTSNEPIFRVIDKDGIKAIPLSPEHGMKKIEY